MSGRALTPRLLVVLLGALGAVLLAPAAASACSVVAPKGPQSVDITVHEAEAAVVGTVVSTTTADPTDPNGFADTVLAVERVVKGAVTASQITLRHSTNDGLCGFEMRVGERYGVVGEAADASSFAHFGLFDEKQLGKDADLDGVGVETDACPARSDPANACAGRPELTVAGRAPARLGLLRRGRWAVRVKSDAEATARVRLTARIRGERRLLAEFVADLEPGRVAVVPLAPGVAERRLIRGRDRLAARLRIVARGPGGKADRTTRAIVFRRGAPAAAPSVVGGRDALIEDWPSIAFMLSGWDTDGSGEIDEDEPVANCTGTLVAPDWVLTAAHCAFDPDDVLADGMLAILGSADVGIAEAETLVADEVVVHPAWNPVTLKGDALLVHLAAESAQPPMPLARRQVEYFLDETVPNLAGWGTTDEDNTLATEILQEAYVDVIDLTDEGIATCAGFDPGGYDPDTQTCAAKLGSAVACHGDSGGPLTVLDAAGEPQLWGLTSYGPLPPDNSYKACDVRLPVIFSWVPALAAWVDAEIAGAPQPPPAAPGPQQPPALPPLPPPSDARAPVLSAVKLSTKRIRPARKGATLARKAGAKLSFALDEAAAVSVTVLKRGSARGAPATFAAGAGRTTKRFTARANGKRLKRGRYKLRVGAVDVAGNVAAPVTLRFRVV